MDERGGCDPTECGNYFLNSSSALWIRHSSPKPARGKASGCIARGQASVKITIQNAAIDARQLLDIGHRRALVDLVHGLAEQPEFDHRAIARDEARIRRAAGGGEFGLAAGHFFDR